MKKIFLLSVLSLFGIFLFAQGIVNDGAVITVTSGTNLIIQNGNYLNQTNTTDGRIDLDGTIYVDGNFTNNAANNVFINRDADGTVVFNGTGTQTISINASDMSNYIDFEGVTVNSGSITELAAGSAATVNGVLNITGTFRLASPATGEGPTGSLITNTAAASNVTGSGALYVDRHFNTSGRWQYISIPVDNATDDLFDNTDNSHPFNANLYTYDESYDAAVDPPNTNYSNWLNTTYQLYDAWTQVAVDGSPIALAHDGTGYVTYNETDIDVSFGGSPSNLNNSGSYSPTITYTLNDNGGGAGDYYDGWNIIGNPYPCALDFTLLSLNNINNCLYMWDGDVGNYKYYNNGGTSYDDGSNVVNGATKYIPAMQSFAVKATSSISPSVTMDALDRVHSAQQMWKLSKNASNYGETQFVKLSTADGDFTDETIVRFIDGSVEGFDNNYDAYKMFPNNPPVMIYSVITNPEMPIAINTLPLEDIGISIPLGFISTEPGTYTITAENVVFDAGTDVKLIDTYENTETDLYEGAEYTFSFDGGEVRDRFYLFTATSGSDVTNPEEETEISSNVWSNNHKLFIAIKSNKMINANVKVYDVLGRTVIDQNVNGTYNIINVSGASGTYFVKLTGANGISQTKKVFIQK